MRHEQAAVHAADAYSRTTQEVGVCLVTSGPGVTNAVTGIATAYMDSVPMVIISGQVPTNAIGEDAFQECDAVGITRPCVKHNFLVKDVRDLAATFKKAFHIARTGRPGPVLIDIPKDVSRDRCGFSYPKTVAMRSYNPVVDQLGFPCTTTLMGLGAYRSSDSKWIGMPGMHGTYEANMTMHHCDVLVAIGARFDDRVIGNPKHFAQISRKIIHIDIDPSSISKRVKVDVPIVGDVGECMSSLLDLLEASFSAGAGTNSKALQSWWAQINEWRKRDCLAYDRESPKIKPQFVVEKLCQVTHGDAIITSDVGQHQMFAAQYYRFDKPRRWVNSGGLGTMGVGLPFAMGAVLANPDVPVACITGEGSIQMCIQELSTCTQYNLPVKIINLNNGALGMVRQWQQIEYEGRYSQSYMEALPDFVKLAEAYGHVGIRVERPEDVEGALRDAFGKYKDRTVFIDFVIDPTENVWPMVQGGKGLTEMLLGAEDL